jgi:hypothetical protein
MKRTISVKKRTSGDIGRGDVSPRCCCRDLANGADPVCATLTLRALVSEALNVTSTSVGQSSRV